MTSSRTSEISGQIMEMRLVITILEQDQHIQSNLYIIQHNKRWKTRLAWKLQAQVQDYNKVLQSKFLGLLQDEVGKLVARIKAWKWQYVNDKDTEIKIEWILEKINERSLHFHMEGTKESTEISHTLSQHSKDHCDRYSRFHWLREVE